MSIESFDYRSLISYSADKAHKVVLGEAAHTRTTLWCLQPGQHIHPHVHAGDHVWVVLEGEGQFLSDGEVQRPVSAGTVLIAPAGMAHGIENTGSCGLVFVSVSAG